MKAAGDHEMENQPNVVIESDRDAFAESPNGSHTLADACIDGRLGSSQQKRILDFDRLETRAQNSGLERLDINRNIRKLRHAYIFRTPNRSDAVAMNTSAKKQINAAASAIKASTNATAIGNDRSTCSTALTKSAATTSDTKRPLVTLRPMARLTKRARFDSTASRSRISMAESSVALCN